MAGYSGTPLAKKLGIKERFRVALVEVPSDVKGEIRDSLAGCSLAKNLEGPLDFVFLFTQSRQDLERKMKRAAAALAAAGMLWVAWPKKTSGVVTDLTEDVVRGIGLRAGLVDVKVCAVTEVWSGLKFVIPVARRSGRAE